MSKATTEVPVTAGAAPGSGPFAPTRVKFAKVFFCLFALATLLNGSAFWLRRVGIMDQHLYQTYLEQFHQEDPDYRRTPAENEALRIFTSDMYHVEGKLVLTKLFKDLVVAAFLVASIWLLIGGYVSAGWIFRGITWCSVSLPLILMVALVALSGCVSWATYGFLFALAGARSMLFLLVAILGGWSVQNGRWRTFVLYLGCLVPIQVLLAPIELERGLHLFGARFLGQSWGDRIVGTLLQPSALGITTVVLLTACYAAGLRGRGFKLMAAAACLIAFFTASATSWILLLLFAGIALGVQVPETYRRRFIAVAMVLGLIILISLPLLIGRADIYDSLWGRIRIAEQQIREVNTPWEFLFGRGLGAGTNTAANLLMDWRVKEAAGYGERLVFVSDSTPLTLYTQLGAVGCLLFYWILLIAGWRDRQAWPLYFIIGMGSLALNITELFPVNIVLGLCLAKSLMLDHDQETPSCAIPP